jgi:hypothetical protein
LRPSDLSVWEERGFVSDWMRGSVLLAHFEPCSLDLTFPRDVSALPQELEVGLGAHRVFRGAPGPARVLARPSTSRSNARLAVGSGYAPCGPTPREAARTRPRTGRSTRRLREGTATSGAKRGVRPFPPAGSRRSCRS